MARSIARSAATTRRERRQQVLGAAAVAATCLAGLCALSGSVLSPSALQMPRALAEASSSAEDDKVCGTLQSWELEGGVFAYLAALCYIFMALAIICDDYFVASLDKITDALALSPDVAGATFMAAGSSSPELFVSLADNVFRKPQESLGAGTIVGSAIFNILIIISMSALLAREVLVLDWRPLLRDSLWYSWAIVVLTYSVWDGTIDVLESSVMVASYALYIAYMTQNTRIVAFCCKKPDGVEVQAPDAEEQKQVASDDTKLLKIPAATAPKYAGASSESESAEELARTHSQRGFLADQGKAGSKLQSKYRMFQYHGHSPGHHEDISMDVETGNGHHHHKDVVVDKNTPVSTTPALAGANGVLGVSEVEGPGAEEEDLGGYFDEVWDVPRSCVGKIWFVITRPIVVVCRFTIPDCRYPIFSGKFGIAGAFFVSIAWIGVLSHFTVEFATKVGCIAGIPSALMGLTVIAVGMSIPDALSSILVARDGHGDMAVSNALGSNVFDILLGVGLPFLLSNLVYGEEVPVSRDDLDMSIFILFGVLLFVVALLILSKWRMYRAPAALMVLAYGAYVAVSYLHGLGKL